VLAPTGPIAVTDQTFEAEVIRSTLPVVVDFYADWSIPCRAGQPAFADASLRLAGRIKFATVNIDDAVHVARSYGIRAVPTFLFLRDGQERGREVGPLSAPELGRVVRRHFPGRARARPSGGRPASR
jgi:thioredoxin